MCTGDGQAPGTGAEAAACDAAAVPVVTGQVDMTVADKMIELALSAGDKPVQAKAMSPGGVAGAAVRDRQAGRRPGLRPGRAGRLPAHPAAGGPVEQAVAAAGHRLVRQHPVVHPQGGAAPGPHLRLAAL